MTAPANKSQGLHERTLAQLVSLVVAHKYPFEDLAEFIEDRAYEVCEGNDSGTCTQALKQLKRLAEYFEQDSDQSELHARNLADIYLLVGELHLYHDRAKEGATWFRRAIKARDNYAAPYHSLALAQMKQGDNLAAARSLEEELLRSPGNLYSYLLLAELYEREGDEDGFEEALRRLLTRDPENVQALHRLIRHYEREEPEAEVELLRQRLISVDRDLNKAELTIWIYHMCREGKFVEALQALEQLEDDAPDSPTVHLLKAAVYGEMRQFTRKKRELALFKRISNASEPAIRGELKQFEDIFGKPAVAKLSRRLAISSPSADGHA